MIPSYLFKNRREILQHLQYLGLDIRSAPWSLLPDEDLLGVADLLENTHAKIRRMEKEVIAQ